jgi:hypothetical protein
VKKKEEEKNEQKKEQEIKELHKEEEEAEKVNVTGHPIIYIYCYGIQFKILKYIYIYCITYIMKFYK